MRLVNYKDVLWSLIWAPLVHLSSRSSSSSRARMSIGSEVMWALIQWHRFPLFVRARAWCESRTGSSEWQSGKCEERLSERWWRARRDGGEWGGKLASAADERRERSSRNVHIRTASPPPTTAGPGDSFRDNKTFPQVFLWQQSLRLMHFVTAAQVLPMVTHQVQLTDFISHVGCFHFTFPVLPQKSGKSHTSETTVTDFKATADFTSQSFIFFPCRI